MANHNINVALGFSADTSKAKAALQDLQNQLAMLSKDTMSNPAKNLDKDLYQAGAAALDLKSKLESASSSTGKLDLSKFNESLKRSGKDLNYYKDNLMMLGPEGRKSFLQLSQSILEAEVPLKRTSALTAQLWDNLKRTAGWQISSTMIHKFVGGIQQAYGYAQDLNESLNNIRIVTGQSTDQMAKFAKEANKSAQALSTTTTAYTDAALIFYQQGLSGEDVTKRTDTVIKMANVTGQSAEEVSSYMTAIWNNFDDGSKSLEHYADVITALGAKTASSSAEIAEGLEKFAAIGSTVGLSYEYATSALATVVAQTRQSADTVGTAFKTLFARIQDLEVGETLEDGTTLGKYAQALQSIGVNIKDASGQVKAMDVILDEMGNKWKTIDKNTQIAVAQAVAGTRQYSQLMALMSNYDTFKSNVNIAQNAEGALQEQADIYAESWEGAQKRVRSALESIYQQLLNDKFFIKLTNTIAEFLKLISKTVTALGGVKGVLSLIGVYVTKTFNAQIVNSLQNFAYNIKGMFGGASKELDQLRKKATDLTSKGGYVTGPMEALRLEATKKLYDMEEKSLVAAKDMTSEQQKELELVIQSQKAHHDVYMEELKEIEALKTKDKIQDNQQKLRIISNLPKINPNDTQDLNQNFTDLSKITEQSSALYSVTNNIFSSEQNASINDYKASLNNLLKVFDSSAASVSDVESILNKTFGAQGVSILKRFEQALQDEKTTPAQIIPIVNELGNAYESTTTEAIENLQILGVKQEDIEKTQERAIARGEKMGNVLLHAFAQGTQGAKTFEDELKRVQQMEDSVSQKIVNFGNLLLSINTAINSFNGLGDIWSDEDTSTLSKITSSLMSISMLLPVISKGAQALGKSKAFASLGSSMTAGGTGGIASLFGAGGAEAGSTAAAGVAGAAGIAAAAAALAAVAIAVVAIVAAYKNWQKELQKTADKAKEEAKYQQELTTKIKEQQNQVKELASAYADLRKQLDEGSISSSEMRTKSYQLCLQYGQEELAVKALAGDYEALGEAIRLSEQEAAQKTANQAKKTKESAMYAGSTQAKASAARDNKFNSSGEIDLKMGMVAGNSGAEKDLIKGLESLGISVGGVGGDNISASQFAQVAQQHYDELNRLLATNDSKAAAQLSNYLADMKESIDLYKESENDFKEAQKESIAKSYDTSMIKSLKSYNETVRKMAQEAYSKGLFDSEKEAQEWARNYMAAIDTVSDYAQKSFLIEKATEKIGNTIKSSSDSSRTLRQVIDKANRDIESTKEIGNKVYYANARDYYEENKDDFNAWLKQQEVEIEYDNSTNNGVFGYNQKLGQLSIAGRSQGYVGLGLTDKNEEDLTLEDVEVFSDNLLASLLEDFAEDIYTKSQIDKAEAENTLNYFNDEVSNALKNSSLREVQFVNDFAYLLSDYLTTDNIDSFSGSELIAKLFEDNRTAITFYGKQAFIDYYDGIQEQLKETKLSKSQIEELFNTQSIEGFDYSALRSATKETQDALLRDEEAQNQLWMQENWAAVLSTYEKQAEFYEQENKEKIQAFAEIDKNLTDEDINTYVDLVSKNGKLTEEQDKKLQEISKRIKEKAKLDEDPEQIVNIIKAGKEYKELTDKVDVYTDYQIDAKKAVEEHDNAIKTQNTALKDIKNSYSALNNAIIDYNQNGYLSLDNIEKISQMEPEYLSALSFENGALKLNKQAYEDVAKAKLYNMQLEELDLALKVLSDPEAEANKKEIERAKLVETTDALAGLVEMRLANVEAMRKEKKLEGTWSEDLENYYNLTMTKYKLYQSTIDNVGSALDKGTGTNKKKYYSDEFDRYWEFKKAIEQTTHEIEKLKNAQDNLFGQELINNLNEVNKLLAQNKADYEAMYEAQKVEQQELQQSLQGYFNFDADGMITNYAEGTAALFKAQGSMSEEAYEKLKKDLERYDTLVYSEMVDTADKLDEVQRQVLENNIKIWETDIQVKLDLKQAKRDWNEFYKTINKNFRSATTDFAKELSYNLEQASTYSDDDGTLNVAVQKVQNINAEIEKLKNGGTSYRYESLSQAEEALKAADEELNSSMKDMQSLVEETYQGYLDMIDQTAEGLEKINQEFEEINSKIEHQKQLIELLYGDKAYDKIGKVLDVQYKNGIAQIQSQREQVKSWQIQLAGLEEGTKEYEKVQEKIQAGQEKIRDLTISTLTTAGDIFKNSVTKAAESIRNITSGTDDADWAKYIRGLTKEQDEGYYDDVEKVYEVQTMRNKVNKMTESMDAKQQAKFKTFAEERLQYLEEQNKLSEYSVELVNKQLDAMQAEMALEDARNAKNSMKMTRGTDGNWSYQYVADEEDINNKTQDWLDKTHSVYEYTKQAAIKTEEDIDSLTDRVSEELKRLALEYGENTEAYNQKAAEIQEKYYGPEGIITQKVGLFNKINKDLNQATYDDLTALYKADPDNYQIMTDKEKELMDGLRDGTLTSFDAIMKKCHEINVENIKEFQNAQYQTLLDWGEEGKVPVGIEKAFEDCGIAAKVWQGEVEDVADAAGIELDNLDSIIEELEKDINAAKDATSSYLSDNMQALSEYATKLNNLVTSWTNQKNAIEEARQKAVEYGSQMESLASKAKAAADAIYAANNAGNGGGPIPDAIKAKLAGLSYGMNEYDAGYLQGETEYGLFKEGQSKSVASFDTSDETFTGYADKFSNFNGDKKYVAASLFGYLTKELPDTDSEVIASAVKEYLDDKNIRDTNGGAPQAFATGGYTGEWTDDSGKLALLHQKELVLNERDTENMLEAVYLMRKLSSSINDSIVNKLGNMMDSWNSAMSTNAMTNLYSQAKATAQEAMNNIFNITAEFPNANNVDEIREAILSLPNLASQRAGYRTF